LWVRQGRTDAWIAHKLDVSLEQLDQFKRDQGLDGDPTDTEQTPEPSVAAAEVVGREEDESEVREYEPEDLAPMEDLYEREPEAEPEPRVAEPPEATEPEPARRRRRGRRGGRRRGARMRASFEATFDHGAEGYGLWFDPAIADEQVYAEHWAGHRAVAVTVEPDAITIRRVEQGDSEAL
jgi:hypothetical protein